MELIDTHCHLNDPNFSIEPGEAILAAKEAGVVQLIVPGMDLATSRRSIELAAEFPGIVFAAVGVHPHGVVEASAGTSSEVLPSDSSEVKEALENLVRSPLSLPKSPSSKSEHFASVPGEQLVVAIGEIGIDYHHHDREETGARQREAFVAQLEFSIELGLPAIVHGRDAYGDVLDVIKAHPKSRGVLHSFESSHEVATQALDLGWLISLTALITYPKYDWLREVVKRLPLDRLMLETDSPYLPPQRRRTTHELRSTGPNPIRRASSVAVGARGRNNQPAYLPEIAEMVATVKGISIDEVARVTTETTREFFKLPTVESSGEPAIPKS